MALKKKIVLYFTPEADITDEQADEMARTQGARQRNAALVRDEDPLEPCDAVAGPAIPEQYQHLPLAQAMAPEPDVDTDDPEHMTVAQLRKALEDAEVTVPSGAKKAALVTLYNETFE